MLLEAHGHRRQAAIDIKGPIRTYAARGLRPSKVSRHRRKRACWDLCCPRLRVVEGEPLLAKMGLLGLMLLEA